jgi:hypothetical protein
MRLLKAVALGLAGTIFFLACSLLGVAIAAGLVALMGPWSMLSVIAAIFAVVAALAYAGGKSC